MGNPEGLRLRLPLSAYAQRGIGVHWGSRGFGSDKISEMLKISTINSWRAPGTFSDHWHDWWEPGTDLRSLQVPSTGIICQGAKYRIGILPFWDRFRLCINILTSVRAEWVENRWQFILIRHSAITSSCILLFVVMYLSFI